MLPQRSSSEDEKMLQIIHGKIAPNNPALARRRHEQETIETETFPSTQEVHCLVDIIV